MKLYGKGKKNVDIEKRFASTDDSGSKATNFFLPKERYIQKSQYLCGRYNQDKNMNRHSNIFFTSAGSRSGVSAGKCPETSGQCIHTFGRCIDTSEQCIDTKVQCIDAGVQCMDTLVQCFDTSGNVSKHRADVSIHRFNVSKHQVNDSKHRVDVSNHFDGQSAFLTVIQ
jgi:hypothetical protein